MSNRIAQYLPVTNRLAVFAPAVAFPCGSFAVVAMSRPGQQAANVYEIAIEAARAQVAAKRRYRACSSTTYLWN